MNLMVSTQGPATSVANAVQREIRAVDGDLGVYDLKTMDTILSDVVALPRFNALLMVLAGASGAVLAVALSACCRPARTAMRVDPMRVLRAE